MAIQYTDPTSITPPTKIATDVFNTPLLKPDATLAALQAKFDNAGTDAQRQTLLEQIRKRQNEIFSSSGFTNVGYGGRGSYLPGGGQGIGYEILEPTQDAGVYSKSKIGTNTSVDPYGRESLSTSGNKLTYFDENGNPLTAVQFAKTKTGQDMAAAGWDIGFGPGNIAPGQRPTVITDVLPDPSGNGISVGLGSSTSSSNTSNISAAQADRQSAYDLLYSQFKLYGLEALVEPLKGLIISGASPSEFTIKLRESDAYKKRFAANAARIQKGLAAISEAEYLGLEDQYQSIMRNYGLPESYYARGEMGTQEGFNKFIANDVSAAELEDRIMTAQNRVMNANPEVLASLKAFYPDINNGDILAYTLDPTKGLDSIKRKVTAAEIGGAATQAGLQTGVTRAEQLGAAGITKAQAQQGFGTIAGGLQRGSQLASIYGENPYTQTTAEQEVFGLAGKTEAAKERKKLTSLEKATFGGQTGVTSGALARDRAGAY